jgi:hypothetical protein
VSLASVMPWKPSRAESKLTEPDWIIPTARSECLCWSDQAVPEKPKLRSHLPKPCTVANRT